MPCDTYAMTRHLAEISRHVEENAHAILIMDQADWHMSNNLVVPRQHQYSATAAEIPGKESVQKLWQFMRQNWLSNRVFKSYGDIGDHCCDAWRKLEVSHGASCPSVTANRPMSSDH
jgi:hypothetical protein